MSIITSVFISMGFLLQKRLLILFLDIQKKFFLIYTKSFLMQNHSLPFRNIFVRNLMAVVMALPSL